MSEILTKVCNKCKVEKPISSFAICRSFKDGHQYRCKDCSAEDKKKYRLENISRQTIVVPNSKLCPGCKTVKPGSDFHKSNGNKDGLCDHCKDCGYTRTKSYYDKNKARGEDAVSIPESKECAKCHLTKPGSDFFKASRNKDGLGDYCKDCATKIAMIGRENNKKRSNIIIPKVKTCPKCKTEKPSMFFSKDSRQKDGLNVWCKICVVNTSKRWGKKNTINHKNGTLAIPNTKACGKCKAILPSTDFGKCSSTKTGLQNLCNNCRKHQNRLPSTKETKNKRHKIRASTDINYRLQMTLRSRLHTALKQNSKSGSAVKDLGCSITFLKTYIENRWLPGMSWNNWAMDGWHIDHIIPLSNFDLTNRNQLLAACHYTNLQPLWWYDNLSKGSKI
jgi:hypothetical protein